MTIHPAAAATAPPLPAAAPASAPAPAGDAAGFGDQLNGLMVILENAAIAKSAANAGDGAPPADAPPTAPMLPAKSAKPPVVVRDRKQLPDTTLAALPVTAPLPQFVPDILPKGCDPKAAADAPAASIEQLPAPQPALTESFTPPPALDIPRPQPPSKIQPGDDKIATPGITAAAGSPQRLQDMAFAARIQPVQSVTHSELPAEMASASAVAAATKKPPAANEVHDAPHADSTFLSPNPTFEHTAPASVRPASPAPEIHRTEAPPPIAENQPKALTPLKDISLQLAQPGSERVDVRVVQHAGEVRVSVHSSDASMNSGLRQGLSDLQSRLEESGYRSEMWRPAAASPVAAAPSAQQTANHTRGGDPQPQQHGGSQQEGGRRNQNQPNQPRWLEEMESSLSGGAHGIRN